MKPRWDLLEKARIKGELMQFKERGNNSDLVRVPFELPADRVPPEPSVSIQAWAVVAGNIRKTARINGHKNTYKPGTQRHKVYEDELSIMESNNEKHLSKNKRSNEES